MEKEPLKAEMAIMRKDFKLTKDFMELMKKEPRLLDIMKGISQDASEKKTTG